MYIKVISCSKPDWWYSDYVDTEFEVYKEDLMCPDGACYTINNINGKGDMGNILVSDCQVIDTISDEYAFVPPTPPKTEIELLQEKVNQLEQYNTFLLNNVRNVYTQLNTVESGNTTVVNSNNNYINQIDAIVGARVPTEQS